MRKIAERLTALVVVVCVVAGFCGASPIIDNASFETGDLTGWSATNIGVVGDVASDGECSVKANPSWIQLPEPGLPTPWIWYSDLSQTLTFSAGVTGFSIDVRSANYDSSQCSIVLGGISGDINYFSPVAGPGAVNLLVDVSPVSDGFTRYTYDVSGYIDYITDNPGGGQVEFRIEAGGDSMTNPTGSPLPEFYVDNIQFITPEPASLSLILLGGLALLRRSRKA